MTHCGTWHEAGRGRRGAVGPELGGWLLCLAATPVYLHI